MNRVSGFVGVMLLPALAALTILLLAVTSQQQQLQQRWHLQSAADAMSYSAAVIMAREFNLLSILNRALIANQVAQAQLLGIASWYQTIDLASQRLAQVSAWIPYVNVVTTQLANLTRMSKQPLEAILRIGLSLNKALAIALNASQLAARSSFAILLPQTLQELAEQQGVGEYSWTLFHSPGLVSFPWLWWTYITPQVATKDDKLFAEMTLASRDQFSANRSYQWFDIGLVKAQKTGGSEIAISHTGKWSWQAMDTLALHVQLLFGKQELPWGYGAKTETSAITNTQAPRFGASRALNPRTTSLAQRSSNSLGLAMSPTYFNRKKLAPEHWPAVILMFEQVTAKAGIRFSRPAKLLPRGDAKHEQANLFNALWEPELQSLTKAEKLILSTWQERSQ